MPTVDGGKKPWRWANRSPFWQRLFEAAPAELRETMNKAMTIRETMKLLKHQGIEAGSLDAYRRQLEQAEKRQWALLLDWWAAHPDAPGAWRVHGRRETRPVPGEDEYDEPVRESEPIDLDAL